MKLILILSAIFSLSSFALTGLEVANKIYNSNRESDSVQTVKMTLTDKSGSKRIRNFVLLSKDNQRYNSQSLIVFTSPKRIEKTGMLTQNNKGDDTNQWIYLPALKKTRRIASSKKSGRFVGSDLSYEDLEDREVELDNHKLIKKDKINNKTYYLLQSTAKDKSTSSYTKVLSWVDPKNWTVRRAHFYKNKNTPAKILDNVKFEKIGSSWVATSTQIEDKTINHKTSLDVISTKFNNNLKKNYFKKSTLENPRKIRKYLK